MLTPTHCRVIERPPSASHDSLNPNPKPEALNPKPTSGEDEGTQPPSVGPVPSKRRAFRMVKPMVPSALGLALRV